MHGTCLGQSGTGAVCSVGPGPAGGKLHVLDLVCEQRWGGVVQSGQWNWPHTIHLAHGPAPCLLGPAEFDIPVLS